MSLLSAFVWSCIQGVVCWMAMRPILVAVEELAIHSPIDWCNDWSHANSNRAFAFLVEVLPNANRIGVQIDLVMCSCPWNCPAIDFVHANIDRHCRWWHYHADCSSIAFVVHCSFSMWLVISLRQRNDGHESIRYANSIMHSKFCLTHFAHNVETIFLRWSRSSANINDQSKTMQFDTVSTRFYMHAVRPKFLNQQLYPFDSIRRFEWRKLNSKTDKQNKESKECHV